MLRNLFFITLKYSKETAPSYLINVNPGLTEPQQMQNAAIMPYLNATKQTKQKHFTEKTPRCTRFDPAMMKSPKGNRIFRVLTAE